MSAQFKMPEASKRRINSILENYPSLFYQKPILLIKKNRISKTEDISEICPSTKQIYLHTEQEHPEPPYIEVFERWLGDEKIEYRYCLCIPFLKCKLTHDSIEKEENYEFRYENHGEKHKLKDHLHVVWSDPHFHSPKMEFEDFFKIVEREFIRQNIFHIPMLQR